MTNDRSVNTTILSEHRGITNARYILATINFIAIFIGTILTHHFVSIRGASSGVVTHINIMLAVNVIQIGLCVADYILKHFLGIYFKYLPWISYGVGGLWLLLAIGELVSGSKELGELRLDLAIVLGIQLVLALIAYVIWPALDHSAIQKLTSKKVREEAADNPEIRAKKARGFIVRYVIICLFVALAQVAMLFAYKVPPRVYDIFSDSRALQYKLNESGDGYIVTGVYLGTSSYANIPAFYNDKPVIGVAGKAFSNVELLDKYKISTITFGTETTDAEGNKVIVSNVKYLEADAISNDKITTLTLPSSIVNIEDGAIESSTLESLIYESKADFSISYLDCKALSKITMKGEDVGNIISLQGMDKAVTIDVAKEIYNQYRKNNPEYVHSFKPILPEDEFCVDFYTDSDYYIKSIFAKYGETISIGYNDLTNDEMTGISPIVDTLSYIKNKNELGTNGAKADSAFRGWYTDASFGQEIIFTETSKASFTGNTSIYAKWIDEYTGTLDWGTYQPVNSANKLYWTDEDVVELPVIADRLGYTDGVVWKVEGDSAQVTNTRDLSGNKTFEATWILDKPTNVDIVPSAPGTWWDASQDGSSVMFTYDELNILDLKARYSHPLENDPLLDDNAKPFTLAWSKIDDLSFENTGTDSIDVQNVKDSGKYVLTVTFRSPYGEEATTQTDISVNISKKALDIGTIRLDDAETQYSKTINSMKYSGVAVHTNIEAKYYYYDKNGDLVSNAGVTDVGDYTVKVVFSKNNDFERGNYQTKELQANYKVTPRYLVFEGWSETDLTYNGATQGVTLNVSGILSNDEVGIIYSNSSAKNAGSYVAVATGVDNPNYSLDRILSDCRVEWSIAPKAVSVKEWTLDNRNNVSFEITYNGSAHSVKAVMDGKLAGDTVNFVYDTTSACTTNATNAGTYTARVLNVDNPNYVFNPSTDANSECDWTINKKAITVVFNSATGLIYNGAKQGIVATVSGIVASDLDKFDEESFVYTGKTTAVNVTEVTGASDTSVKLEFATTDAGTYTAVVAGVNSADTAVSSNYTLTSKTSSFTIAKKTLTVVNTNSYIYNGADQVLKIYVDGFVSADIDKVTFAQFEGTNLISGEKASGTKYALSLTGKNAGSYNYSIDSYSDTNYELAESTGSVSIAKKPITLTKWTLDDLSTGAVETEQISTNKAVIYNKNGYTVSPNVTGVIAGETVNLSVTNDTKQSVGSYTTTVSLPSSYTNYSFTTKTISWEIEPYEVDISWKFNGVKNTASVPSYVYNATSVTVSPSYEIFDGDTLSLTYSKNDMTATDAGEYYVTVSSLGNSNYVLGDGASLTWKITPKAVTVVWPTGSASSVYNGAYQGPSFALNGLCEYTDLKVSTTVNGSLADFAITSTSSDAKYSYATAGVAVNAGTYELEVKEILKYDSASSGYVTDTNYVISDSGYEYSITKRPLTLTGVWTYNNTKTGQATYVSALMYNAATYTIATEIDPSCLVNHLGTSASVSLVYSSNTAKNASTYTAEIISLSGTHASNYSLPLTGLTKTYKISPKPINFEWGTLTYTYNGSTKTVTASVVTGATSDGDGKAYTGDSVSVSTYSGRSGINAGTYTAKVIELSNDNYCINEGSATHTTSWTISPKPITLTWGSESFVYNKGVQYPSATYSGEGNVVNAVFSATPTSADAGDYTIVAVGVDNDNYVLSLGQELCSYTITPKPVTISWRYGTSTSSAGSYTYDAAKRTLNAVITNAITGDTVEAVVSGNTTIQNAGTYTCNVTGVSNSNYTIDGVSNTEKTIVVSPRVVSISWSTNSFTYDKTQHTLSATVTGVGGVSVPFSYDTANRSLTNVGSLTVGIASLGDSNYTLSGASYTSKTLTVSAKTLTLTWSGTSSLTYDGASHTLDASLSGICAGDTVSLYYSTTSKDYTNAGSYTITVSGISGESSGNYTLSSSNRSKTLSISKRALTATWDSTKEYVYDGKAHTLDVTLGNIVAGDSVTPNYSTDTSFVNAGSHTVKFTGVDNTNYSVSASQQTLVITPATLTLTWPSTRTFTYDGKSHSIYPTASGFVTGESAELVYASSTNVYTNAGSYVVEVTGVDDDNYVIASDATTKQTLTINKKAITLTWPSTRTFVYDGEAHSIKPTISGVVSGESVSLTYSGSTSYVDAGTYTITVSKVNNSNYTFATGTVLVNTMVISPAELTISWPTTTTTFTYDGSSHSFVPSISAGVVSGDSVALVLDGDTSFVDAGSYTVKIAGVSNTNYVIKSGTILNKTITISKKTVTVVWPSTKTFTYDGASHSLTPSLSGVVTGETVKVSYTGDPIVNAGTETFTVIGIDNDNYYLSQVSLSATLTINPATVTITWPSTTSFVYDGNAHSLVPTVKGVGGESVAFTYSNGNSLKNVGSLNVVIELANNNYTLTGATGTASKTLTVTPQEVTISWSGDTDVVFDGNAHSLVASVVGKNDDKSVAFTYSANGFVNAGTWTSSVTLADSNYVIADEASASKTITIEKAQLSLTWNVDTDAKTASASADAQLVDGAELSYTIVKDGVVVDAINGAGDYVITATIDGTAASNYEIASGSTTSFTIEGESLEKQPATEDLQ